MKAKLFIIILISFILSSCGINRDLRNLHEHTVIRNLRVRNNNLTFTTVDSVYVHLFYFNLEDDTDHFRSWSTTGRNINHNYSLPVSDRGIRYDLSIFTSRNRNISTFPDTSIVFTSVSQLPGTFMTMHFINVQQGDAVLIQTPLGRNILYDGGWGTLSNLPSNGGGIPIARNYLIENSVFRLDYIIESHYHGDHWGGLRDIVRSNEIDFDTRNYIAIPDNRRTWIPDLSQLSDVSPGDTLPLCSSVTFNVFNIRHPRGSTNDQNNDSIVLRVDHRNSRFLLTGDAENIVQNFMYSKDFDLSVDVLKVSHHGADSNQTTNDLFLRETLNRFPQIAILSFGTGNSYNHPRNVNRFWNFQTYFTNWVHDYSHAVHGRDNFHITSGTIVVHSDGNMVFVSTENIPHGKEIRRPTRP